MTTINDVIEKVDKLKPNTYDSKDKFDWINELDGLIFQNILSRAEDTDFTFTPYDYETDIDADVLVQAPYNDIYFYFLSAKIDYNDNEITSYNNNISTYNSYYDDFAAFYRRNHVPKRGY